MTNDDQKSVLDVIGWCKDLEEKIKKLEAREIPVIDHGDFIRDENLKLQKGEGERSITESITFNKAFKQVPVVKVSLSGIDTGDDRPTRIDVRAENVTTEGCDIVMGTWGNSHIYFLKVNWTAIGY